MNSLKFSGSILEVQVAVQSWKFVDSTSVGNWTLFPTVFFLWRLCSFDVFIPLLEFFFREVKRLLKSLYVINDWKREEIEWYRGRKRRRDRKLLFTNTQTRERLDQRWSPYKIMKSLGKEWENSGVQSLSTEIDHLSATLTDHLSRGTPYMVWVCLYYFVRFF